MFTGHAIVVSPGSLHGDTAVCDEVGFERTGEITSIHGLQHEPNVLHSKIPLLVAGGANPFVLTSRSTDSQVVNLDPITSTHPEVTPSLFSERALCVVQQAHCM